MEMFVGIVEDRFDPLKLGRCRIRIFGTHIDDKVELPTSELPWAMPVQGITSAATSGVGTTPIGPVHGTWVIGFWMDGEDKQQPMMLGTVGAIQNVSSTSTSSNSPSTNTTTAATVPTGVKVDVPPVANTTTGITPVEAVRQPNSWIIGQTSKKYESGGKGCGTINAYTGAAAGDLGGASYGTYQLASYLPATMSTGKNRPSATKSPLVTYIKQSKFAARFEGLQPATPAWDAKWTECANQNNKEFEEDQHNYIKANYYDVAIGNLRRNGLDLSSFGAGVQDLVWSTAVQLGPGRKDVFLTPLKGKTQLDDVTIITLVSDWKIANVDTLFSKSSQSIKDGVKKRYEAEKRDLLKLASAYNSTAPVATNKFEQAVLYPNAPAKPVPVDPDNPTDKPSIWVNTNKEHLKVYTDDFSPKKDEENVQVLLATSTGYSDPDGVYPLREYNDHPDTNKLATGVIKGTAAEAKSLDRAIGMALPGGDSFDQPLNPYNAKYPYNKVFQSESGHVVEYDDTPGSERINLYHKSGTFIEIDAIGNMVKRTVGSDYQIIDTNGYVYVEGQCNLSVSGSCNIMVGADANIEVSGNTNIFCGNDIVAEAAGRLTVSAGEAIDMRSKDIFIEADNALHISAATSINVESKGTYHMKSTGEMRMQATGNMHQYTGGTFLGYSASTYNIKSNTNMFLWATSAVNINAGTDAMLYGTGTASMKSAGVAAIDGSTMQLQGGVAKTATVGTAASTATGATFGKAGLIDVRTEYAEEVFDDEFPHTMADEIAMRVETPEEAANGGTEAVHAELVKQGAATSVSLSKGAVDATPVADVLAAAQAKASSLIDSAKSAVSGVVSDATKYVQNAVTGIPGVAAVTDAIKSGTTYVKDAVTGQPVPVVDAAQVDDVGTLPASANTNTTGATDAATIAAAVKAAPKVAAPVVKPVDTAYVAKLSDVPASYKLSPNFTLGQLSQFAPAQKDKVKAQFGLTEGEIVANLQNIAVNVLEPIKKQYPNMFVTSGFRASEHNTVKGISQHCQGFAVDMQFTGAKKNEYYEIAKVLKTLIPYDQLLLEYKTTGSGNPWIHVSLKPKDNRNQVLTFFNNKPHSSGLTNLA